MIVCFCTQTLKQESCRFMRNRELLFSKNHPTGLTATSP